MRSKTNARNWKEGEDELDGEAAAAVDVRNEWTRMDGQRPNKPDCDRMDMNGAADEKCASDDDDK